ncbi:MAG: preprotein translocase subunit SecG [Clostridium sp.]|uniref:preprotein translocase subunit SecG n=1 Tax=Clostridium sp. TaxID=1506 RepID=UPI003D6CC259
MQSFLIVLLVIVSIVIIVSVMMQPSKSDGLSGLVGGGGSDTFFAKNKTKTAESVLAKITAVSGVLFAVIILLMNFIN